MLAILRVGYKCIPEIASFRTRRIIRTLPVLLHILLLIHVTEWTVAGQVYLHDLHREMAKDLTLQGNLRLLNMGGEQPDHIQRIYNYAFRFFSESPEMTFADLSGDRSFIDSCMKYGMISTGGPMLGNVSQEGVDVWLRTLRPASVMVIIGEGEDLTCFGPVATTPKTELIAIVQVRGLESGTKYPYQALVDGISITGNMQTFFITTTKKEKLDSCRIAFGSCFHRWGLCNRRLSDQIRSREPMAILLNGDIAVQDRGANIAMHRADYLLRDFQPAWRDLSAQIPIYATWDDHDYFGNDMYNIPRGNTVDDKENLWRVFRNSWNNPSYGFGEKGKGVFFRTRIGPADIIMLDNRYFRQKGSFLGVEQMKWLEEQLLDCEGPFIILSCGTMWSDFVTNGKDSWVEFDPQGREKIFRLIEKNRIGGVLLISGDRHGARGFTIPRSSGFTFYEFGAASLGGRVGPPPIRADWDTQLYGVSGEYAFGEFSFNNTLPDPEVTFRLIHESGTVYYEVTLTKSQLTP
ncbi:MAG TPA: alkaline phosphatase family protein [Bacteroides sp.]|nr:alkaline phosphatase family protein [Bacteroides sp.]